ncbi:hypothetical protein SCHPADRAFT_1003220 [Schizopora paradoxa]|uniref:F-box domain-containing protein n=1 Tax=Schizopora paradoxa TaxID=27342 RepID=A0A0H2R5G4_9AGAM|nr:hypothetical protein SCHPADRAFT_1003220 [Schizopora paradoxa]
MAQNLSEDILYLVFLHALPCVVSVSSMDFYNDVHFRRLPPFNFSLVCRTWRSVCMTRPRLWCAIHATRLHQGHFPLINNLIKYWLLRGGSASFDLTLGIVDGIFFRYPEDNLLDLVVGEWHRWNEIQITVDPYAWQEATNSLSFRCSASTKALRIGMAYRSDVDMRFGNLDLTPCTSHVAAQLQVLEIDSSVRWVIPKSDDHSGSALFLPNLQHLAFSTDCNIGIDVVLAACPKVFLLVIDVSNNTDLDQTRMESVALPYLTNLTIKTRSDAVSNVLLKHLTCTSLREFEFMNSGEVTPFCLQSIAKFLSKSYPVRSRLCGLFLRYVEPRITDPQAIDPPGLHSEHALALKEILHPLEDLHVLHLDGVFINKEIVEFLTPRLEATTSILCPSLNSLFIFCKRAKPGVLNEALEEMIVSRWKTRKGALSIDLYFRDFGDFARKSRRIQECASEGLVIRFD